MTVPTQWLVEVHDSIITEFANRKYISIAFPAESSSQKYEIEYKILGAQRQEDGSVVTVRGHKITLAIPFGYPNFAPTCKPLTSIFHPDIDPDAICISDFWTKSKSLPELIDYIGLLISGHKFGTENTYNPDAAIWYGDNPKKIPFDTVDLQELIGDSVSPEKDDLSEDDDSERVLADKSPEGACELAERYKTEEAQKKKKKTLITGGTLLVVVVLIAGYLLGMDLYNYNSAAVKWHDYASLLQNKKYQKIDKKSKDVLAQLSQIRFIKKEESDALRRDVESVVTTPEFKGGLAGKVLFESRYLPRKTVAAITSFRQFVVDGDTAFQKQNWQGALGFYEKAKVVSSHHKEIDSDQVGKMKLALAMAGINHYFEEGKKLFASKNIDDAVTSFQKAAELANSLDGAGAGKVSQIHAALDRALLEKFVMEGEGAFTAIELDKALESFEKALLLAKKESIADYNAENIRRSIHQVKLYKLLVKGKNAYEASVWEDALASFEEASQFLSNSSLGHEAKAENEIAVSKKILQTKIKIIEGQIDRSKLTNDYNEVLRLEQEIVQVINSSRLKSDSEFKGNLATVAGEISSIRVLLDLQGKREYLLKNYQDIFHDNHTLARSATLSFPIVTFVEEVGGRQFFNLKCTGRTANGKISLELNYQYDLQQKKWRVGGLKK